MSVEALVWGPRTRESVSGGQKLVVLLTRPACTNHEYRVTGGTIDSPCMHEPVDHIGFRSRTDY